MCKLNNNLQTIMAALNLTTVGLVVTAVLVIVVVKSLVSRRSRELKLPPGPSRLPIIGSLHHLGKLPHQDLAKLAAKHGPVMLLHLGRQPCIVATSPAAAEEFLKRQGDTFSARPVSAAAKILTYQDLGFGSGTSPAWRHLRKFFQVELTGPRRLEATSHVRDEEVTRMLRSIAHNGSNSVTNLHQQINEMDFIILSRMVISHNSEQMEAYSTRQVMIDFVKCMGLYAGDYFPIVRWLDLQGQEARFQQVHRQTDEFINRIIHEHQDHRESASPGDMVDLLLDQVGSNEVTLEHVKGIILNAFVAGTDTTVLSTEWAMTELLRNPEVLQAAQAEIDSMVGRDRRLQEHDLRRLKLISAIVKETLRLHPVVPLNVPRLSRNATTAFGFDIPAQSMLLVNVWAIGRDESVWENALEFNPGRFLAGGKHAGVDYQGAHPELLPFGAGRRMCPGMAMGTLMLQFTIASLLHAFDWTPEGSEQDVAETVGLTVNRATPLKAIATARLPPHLYHVDNENTNNTK